MLDARERVHFVGIGGAGMSGIAKVLLEMGFQVSGSDVAAKETTRRLEEMGAHVFIGHDARHVDENVDVVVVSTDVPANNPEVVNARKMNKTVIHRSEVLAKLLNERFGIAVAGAHGKTTVTSMISLILEKAGLDPTILIGGDLPEIGGNAKLGNSQYLVAEADESDQSFLRYRPAVAVVNNIEPDHLENYGGDFNNLVNAYRRFIANVKDEGVALICTDDPILYQMKSGIEVRTVAYGLKNPADFMATDIELLPYGSRFTVIHQGTQLGTVELSVPGGHNVQNALAATAAAYVIGISFESIKNALHTFHGAKRRFQIIGEVGGVLVVDDYAHHPTEIKATIHAAKGTGRRVIAVFQPQRYTRTYFLLEDFARAFSEADVILLAPIYAPAGQQAIPGISSEVLARKIESYENREVTLLPTIEQIVQHLAEIVRPGDLVLTMGAGNIWKAAEGLVQRLTQQEIAAETLVQ